MITISRKNGMFVAVSSFRNEEGNNVTGHGYDAELAIGDLVINLRSLSDRLFQVASDCRKEAKAAEELVYSEMDDIQPPVEESDGFITDARGRVLCKVPLGADEAREVEYGTTAGLIVTALNELLERAHGG